MPLCNYFIIIWQIIMQNCRSYFSIKQNLVSLEYFTLLSAWLSLKRIIFICRSYCSTAQSTNWNDINPSIYSFIALFRYLQIMRYRRAIIKSAGETFSVRVILLQEANGVKSLQIEPPQCPSSWPRGEGKGAFERRWKRDDTAADY